MSPLSVRTSRSTHDLETGNAKLWMLLVGVNHYHDPQLPSLQYSAIDCQGVGEALVEATHAFPQKDIQIYHDAATLPHLDAVRASLKQIVAKAEPQDTVLFYFSGHGMLEPRKEQAFLCFADTQKGTLIDTGLSVVELLHLLGNCAARQQLIWLDACHSGGMTLMGTGARAAKDVEPLANPTPQLVDVLRQRASQSQGFYALLSCDRAQQSWEFPELGHGVFSYYLMRGLRGEAADAQGVIEADGLYKYVYHQTLQYIDKTNQQLRLINQQKRGRGDTQLHSEYPLQTPKRIVEGIGELVLGLQARSPIAPHPRTALVVNGLVSHPNAIGFSRLLRSAGGFDLTFRPQPGNDWSDLRAAIQTCLRSTSTPAWLNAELHTSHPTPHTPLPETTAFLYLRGRIEETAEGESWLLLGDDVRLSRSWLRQALRQAGVAQQVVVLDCPGAVSLASWVDDLQLNAETPTRTGHDRGQCLLAAASSLSQPDRFLQILLQTLTDTDAQAGLPIAGWITRLQVALAGSGMPLHVWLSGARGVIEILPGSVGSRGTDTTEGFDVGVCPYMGLRSFSETDVQYFYGRETLTQTLLQQLNQRSCLAVVGASGSGKSSVVQAGLLAQLQQGKQLPGSDRWWLGSLRPGAHPINALAHRLVETGSEKEKAYQQQQLEGLLYQGAEGFVHWLRQRSEPMVVLMVDQFEELFTLAAASERQQFLALLFGAMEYASDRFKLVFTLRADFIAACLEVPELATILQRSSVLVPPTLTDDDYRQVIIQPAAQVGLQVEPELVEVLLAELSHSAGALPLLEFVLEQLWSRRQAGVLTLQTYQQLGGLKVALERNAQAVYDNLDADAQACAQWIFLALTQLGENTEDTRRRIPKTDLIVPKYPEPLVDRTLHALTTAKLIVISLDDPQPTAQSRGDTTDHPSTPHPTPHTPHPNSITIEVAHEILIRHWSTLRWWLDENRSRLRAQRQIAEAATLWQQHDRQPDFLLQGIRLAEAEELYIKYVDELPQSIQQFIEACLEARQQQQRQAKRRLRRAQIMATVIGALGVMACGFAGVAYWQQRNAQLREVDALAASSEALLASNQQLESLVASVQAGSQLRQLRSLWGIPLGLPIAIETRTTGALQQAITQTQELNRLEGHTNKVNAVSFSPDGQRLATAGDDKTIKLWRRDGTLIKDLIGHSDRVTALAFSPDGKLATTSADKTIKLWDSDGNLITTLTGHQDWVTSVSFSPNGLLATASRDRTVKLWRITGNQASLLLTITGAKGWVNSVQFSPNGQWLAAAGEDGLIRIWRTVASNRPPVSVFLGGGDRITAIAFSPNGATIASASTDKTVKLWSLTGRLLQTFNGHSDQVNSVRFSPDGKQLATAGDRTIKLWSLDGTLLQTFQGHHAEVNSVALSPDGTTLVSASVDKTVRLWRVSRLQTYGSGLYSASFSPDGTRFATAGWDKTIQIWQRDGMTTKLVMTLKGHQASIAAVSFSPDGQWLASGSTDKMVKLWKLPDGILARSLTGHIDSITTLSFSPDSKTLATGSADKTIRLWNVPDGLLVRSLSGHTDGITAVRFSPDGQRLASGSNDNTIRLWNLAGTDSKILGKHGLAISALSFNHDGKTLASGSWDDTMKLWDVNNGTLLKTLLNHSDGVTSLDFSPDRDLLAVGGTDATLKLWDIQHETPLKTLTRHVDSLRSVHFSPTGQTLISTSETSGAIVWELALETLLKQGCSQLHDYLQTQPSIASIRKQC